MRPIDGVGTVCSSDAPARARSSTNRHGRIWCLLGPGNSLNLANLPLSPGNGQIMQNVKKAPRAN